MFKELLRQEILIQEISELTAKVLNSKKVKKIKKLVKEKGEDDIILTFHLGKNFCEVHTERGRKKHFLASFKWVRKGE